MTSVFTLITIIYFPLVRLSPLHTHRQDRFSLWNLLQKEASLAS